MSVGQVVSTGNSVINGLPVGAILEVTGKGQFTVREVPVVALNKGDRVNTKYGPGTVVGLTSRLDDVDLSPVEGNYNEPVWYIADNTNMVRVADRQSLSKI